MNNSGFEFAATYRNRDHDFKYEVVFEATGIVCNRVTSLGFGTDSYISGAYITNVGEEIGKFSTDGFQMASPAHKLTWTNIHKKAPKFKTAFIRT